MWTHAKYGLTVDIDNIDTSYFFSTGISTSQIHNADFLDWAPIPKTLLKKLNASSTVFPASLSLFSGGKEKKKSLETFGKKKGMGKKANHTINFLVYTGLLNNIVAQSSKKSLLWRNT